MAQRRMFSLKIVDTDAFLDMPQSSQLLYFHLAMRADDEGFVSNPKKIIRITNSNEDDIKVLITKRFLLPFESGVCVIKHWRVHNYIQKDRFTATQYIKERDMLSVEEETQKYVLSPEFKQVVSKVDTQVRIGKDRVGKESKDLRKYFEESITIPDNEYKELALEEKEKFLLYWTEKNPKGKKELWQMKLTFDVKRRWATWVANVEKRMKPKVYEKKVVDRELKSNFL